MRLLLSISLLCGLAAAQDSLRCSDYPISVNIVLPNGSLVRGAAPGSFLVKAKPSIQVTDVAVDPGPKRVIFVIDLAMEPREVEKAALTRILASARKEDRFGLVAARGMDLSIQLSEPAKLLSTLDSIEFKKTGRQPGIWTAVTKAVELFGPPEFGDSIVIMAGFIPPKEDAFAPAQLAIERHGARVFAISFAPINVEWNFSAARLNGRFESGTIANREQLDTLTWSNGGYLSFFITEDDQRRFNFYAVAQQQIDIQAWQVYGAIVEAYRVRLQRTSPSPEKWQLDLAPGILQKMAKAKVVYPRSLCTCSP
jgi:hypothetical protein